VVRAAAKVDRAAARVIGTATAKAVAKDKAAVKVVRGAAKVDKVAARVAVRDSSQL